MSIRKNVIYENPKSGLPKIEKEEQKIPLQLLFGGDIFLDRSVRLIAEKKGIDYLWAGIESFLGNFDYKIANLEGPILYTKQGTPGGSFIFSFLPEYIDKLKDLDFFAFSLANNHTLNKGQLVLEDSRKYLENLEINVFGDPSNKVLDCCKTFVYENNKLIADSSDNLSNSFKIALVGEHDLVEEGKGDILDKITELDSLGYFVIVMPHWGTEYDTGIPVYEKRRAYELVDAGADLIIGSHPHVVQSIEIYKEKVIFYSLGNFLFDQYFSYDTLHGLLVEVVFDEKDINFTLYPTEQDKTFQIHLADSVARQKMLDRLADDSVVSEDVRNQIREGKLKVSNR